MACTLVHSLLALSLCVLCILTNHLTYTTSCLDVGFEMSGGSADSNQQTFGCKNWFNCSLEGPEFHIILNKEMGGKVSVKLYSTCEPPTFGVTLILLSDVNTTWVLEGLIKPQQVYVNSPSTVTDYPYKTLELVEVEDVDHQDNGEELQKFTDKMQMAMEDHLSMRQYTDPWLSSINFAVLANEWNITVGSDCCLKSKMTPVTVQEQTLMTAPNARTASEKLMRPLTVTTSKDNMDNIPNVDTTPISNFLSAPAQLGLGIGVGFLIVAIIAVAISLLLYYCYKNKKCIFRTMGIRNLENIQRGRHHGRSPENVYVYTNPTPFSYPTGNAQNRGATSPHPLPPRVE